MTPGAVVAFRQFAGDPQTLGDMLSTPGALRSGHFELLSGQHTDTFLAFSAIVGERPPGATDLQAGIKDEPELQCRILPSGTPSA